MAVCGLPRIPLSRRRCWEWMPIANGKKKQTNTYGGPREATAAVSDVRGRHGVFWAREQGIVQLWCGQVIL